MFFWSHNGQMGIIGDAAHAIVPFFGQGTNSGLEGLLYLMKSLIGMKAGIYLTVFLTLISPMPTLSRRWLRKIILK